MATNNEGFQRPVKVTRLQNSSNKEKAFYFQPMLKLLSILSRLDRGGIYIKLVTKTNIFYHYVNAVSSLIYSLILMGWTTAIEPAITASMFLGSIYQEIWHQLVLSSCLLQYDLHYIYNPLYFEGNTKTFERMMNLGKYILSYVLVLFCTSAICHAATPAPTDAGTIFGPRPLFAAGGATKVIVDDFGYIDYTLTDQTRSIIRNSISDWKSQGIHYGAYYGLGVSETSAATDPAILDVSRVVNLDGTLENNFSFTRQGQLDYLLASGKLAIDLGSSYIFMDVAAPNLINSSFDSETLSAFNTYLGRHLHVYRAIEFRYIRTHQLQLRPVFTGCRLHQFRQYLQLPTNRRSLQSLAQTYA